MFRLTLGAFETLCPLSVRRPQWPVPWTVQSTMLVARAVLLPLFCGAPDCEVMAMMPEQLGGA
jgi:hypothetical protein